jgi:CBS domain-containing protein
MQVKELMTRKVVVVHPNNTLREAADLMKVLAVGSLPVCDGDCLVGMITDRDITVRGVAEGQDPWKGLVRDVMTPEVIGCCEDSDIGDAAQLMKTRHVHRLPVFDRDKRLVGIFSLGDLAAGTSDAQLSAETLKAVSYRAASSSPDMKGSVGRSPPAFCTSTRNGGKMPWIGIG